MSKGTIKLSHQSEGAIKFQDGRTVE
jgi:hypothetical protein